MIRSDENDKIRPGKKVAGNELGLSRGTSTRVDEQGNCHQVWLLERLLDHLLRLLQAERLVPANLALQHNHRHSRFRLHKGRHAVHAVTSFRLCRNISLCVHLYLLDLSPSISQFLCKDFIVPLAFKQQKKKSMQLLHSHISTEIKQHNSRNSIQLIQNTSFTHKGVARLNCSFQFLNKEKNQILTFCNSACAITA